MYGSRFISVGQCWYRPGIWNCSFTPFKEESVSIPKEQTTLLSHIHFLISSFILHRVVKRYSPKWVKKWWVSHNYFTEKNLAFNKQINEWNKNNWNKYLFLSIKGDNYTKSDYLYSNLTEVGANIRYKVELPDKVFIHWKGN